MLFALRKMAKTLQHVQDTNLKKDKEPIANDLTSIMLNYKCF